MTHIYRAHVLVKSFFAASTRGGPGYDNRGRSRRDFVSTCRQCYKPSNVPLPALYSCRARKRIRDLLLAIPLDLLLAVVAILIDVYNAHYLAQTQLMMDPNAYLYSAISIPSMMMASDTLVITNVSAVRFGWLTLLGINAVNTLAHKGHGQNFVKTLKHASLSLLLATATFPTLALSIS